MGFLSDLGLDNVEADPNHMPDGKYKGFVYDAKIVALKDTSKGVSLVLTYKVAPDEPQAGKQIDEWKSANSFDDASKKAWLKQRILSLGVPEQKINDIDPGDLIGTPVEFTVKKKGEYTNVTSVKALDGASVADEFGGASVGANGATGSSDISDLL